MAACGTPSPRNCTLAASGERPSCWPCSPIQPAGTGRARRQKGAFWTRGPPCLPVVTAGEYIPKQAKSHRGSSPAVLTARLHSYCKGHPQGSMPPRLSQEEGVTSLAVAEVGAATVGQPQGSSPPRLSQVPVRR